MARSGRGRLPKGWKILGDDVYCPTCKTALFAIRAVVLPIAGPVDHSWVELRAALHDVWSATTACANWMTTELYARDVRRQPGEVKLARMPRIYLYPEARALFPALPAQSLPALELELQRQYRAHRHELLWTRSRALASHRYPYPLPVPSRSWCLTETGGVWHLSFRLGDARWTVRLRGGPEMRYHSNALRQIATGMAIPGAASLYQRESHRDDHRPDGAHPETRVMVRIPAWFPREIPRDVRGMLAVRTHADHFLVAGDEAHPWVLNADQVCRWVMGYDRRRQRLMQDLRAEQRAREQRAAMLEGLATLGLRFRHRIDSWTDEASRLVVNYAVRQRVAGIHYDDRIQTYVRSYPWHMLRQRVQQKAHRAGLAFECAGEPGTAMASAGSAAIGLSDVGV